MLTSLAIMNDATRVRLAWKASAIRSNCSVELLGEVVGHAQRRIGQRPSASSCRAGQSSARAARSRAPSRGSRRQRARSAAPRRVFSAAPSLAARSRAGCPSRDRIAARSFVRVALAEQLVEHLARIVLHRQRLDGRAEGNGAAEAAAVAPGRRRAPPPSPVSSSDGSGVSCPMCARGDLVGRDAACRPSRLLGCRRTSARCRP